MKKKATHTHTEWTMHNSLGIVFYCLYLNEICWGCKKKILHLNECFVQYNLLLKGDGSLTIREQKWDRTTQEINKHS